MAAGITQPGGAGTTIFIEDDTASPGGAFYTAADMSAAFPADFVDLGTTPKTYRIKVSVQNGDGTLTNKTTWKDTRVGLFWDATKTYLVNVNGRVNRFTDWGTLLTGATGRPIGTDGCLVYFGADTNIGGNLLLYGCELRNVQTGAATGRILLLPATVGTYSELIDTDVYTGSTQGYGSSVKSIDRIVRLTAGGFGSGTLGRIVQFNCPNAETITLSFPNGNQKINNALQVIIRDLEFVGPSAFEDINAPSSLMEPIWSRNCVKSVAGNVDEWYECGVIVSAEDTATPVPGAVVEIVDSIGRTLFATVTGADGRISYASIPSPVGGTAPFPNAILVNGLYNPGGTSILTEFHPFVLHVNRLGELPQYAPYRKVFKFPSETFLTDQKQYLKIANIPVQLRLVSSAEISIEADGVIRILAPVPAIAA